MSKDEDFKPEEEDIGLIGEITDMNREGLEKLAGEEKSEEYRSSNRYIRKLKKIYRKYVKKPDAETQTIQA
ncbi:MAG: hypothetical protein ABEJ87_03815 [Candidatus Nanohalobium sp.]